MTKFFFHKLIKNNVFHLGWILKENEPLDFYAYIAVLGQIRSIDEITRAFIFFTTDTLECPSLFDLGGTENSSSSSSSDASSNNLDDERSAVFPLKWVSDRSKFAIIPDQKQKSLLRRSQRLRNSMTTATNGDSSTDSSSSLSSQSTSPTTTLLVAEFTANLKHSSNPYYACLYVATKNKEVNSGSFRFTHQGDSAFGKIITSKDLLPLFLVIIFYIILLCFSALFSGLNLGKLNFWIEKNVLFIYLFF